MSSSNLAELPPISAAVEPHRFMLDADSDVDDVDIDGDTASQLSISLDSPANSQRNSVAEPGYKNTPISPTLIKTFHTSSTITKIAEQEAANDDQSDNSSYRRSERTSRESKLSMAAFTEDEKESPATSAAPSVIDYAPKPALPARTTGLKTFKLGNSAAPTVPASPRQASAFSPISNKHSSLASMSSLTSMAPASIGSYPPRMHKHDSVASSASSSRKVRPESILPQPKNGTLVLGIALVDFNHLVGPKIEYSKGEIFQDEELEKILPFLALPDGAHLSEEDYSYFHLVPAGPNPTTIFGISCNRQIASTDLLVRSPSATRSTVQKAVVVLCAKPLFGPIRDKLGVVVRTLFAQRDFTETAILDDFGAALELSLRSQLTESGLYMGTSLRELVHTFRQRTLVLVKALMLQKRIMFYGHPVERLCTYQYSLVSLLPDLLQTLEDSGSPPLASRALTLSQPTSLKTSDPKSMMRYMGLPLDLFGKDALFQPYLPLQQLDMIKETGSWLCGSTNAIVTQVKEVQILVNIETGILEYRDPNIERLAGLTSADRKWMDDILTDVNDGWDDSDPSRPIGGQFKGSDDYLRAKFEEYVNAALSSVKYQDFIAKGHNNGVLITGSGGDDNSAEDFNPLWIAEFRKTNAFEVWERTTDPMLFDIVEPRHPCNEKPSVVADIGLRLQEGIQDLKLEQQLAPAREAVTRTLNAGSTNFFKAVEGVRGRWAQQRSNSNLSLDDGSGRSSPVEVTKADLEPPSSSAGGQYANKPLLLSKSTESTTPDIMSPSKIAAWGASLWSRTPKFVATSPALPPKTLSLSTPAQPDTSLVEEPVLIGSAH